MNQRMDQMIDEFGDRLDKQHFNDHDRVQIRPQRREFNVRRVVRQVNIDVDEFVADNTDMSDVAFKDMSVGDQRCFGQQWNSQFVWEKYGDKCVIIGINFSQMYNYRYRDHNVEELGGDLGTINLKILVFQMKNGPEVYLEWEKKVDWIF